MEEKNKNILISTSMLHYLWSEKRQDNIDLLKIFVNTICFSRFDLEHVVDVEIISRDLKEKYGLDNVPRSVIMRILDRVSRKEKYYKKKNYEFILIKKDLKLISEFEKTSKKSEDDVVFVFDEIKKMIRENKLISENKITDEYIQKLIYNYLNKNGYAIIKSAGNFPNLNYGSDRAYFLLNMMLIDNYQKGTKFFKCFYNVLVGFMIANIIYVQIDNKIDTGLKDVAVYLDTPLLLKILGCKSDEQQKVTLELLEMLKKSNCRILAFHHNYKELIDVLYAYKNSIGSKNKKSYHNLIGLEEKGYSVDMMEIFIEGLMENLKKYGISVVQKPEISEEYKKLNLDYKVLIKYIKEEYIKSKSKNINDDNIYIDVDSINAIKILRGGKKFDKIELSKAILVTDNYILSNNVNSFLGYNPFNDVGLVISDNDLATLLWQKSLSTNDKVLELRMISNALCALEPNEEFIERLIEIGNQLEKSGLVDSKDFLNTVMINSTKRHDLVRKAEGNADNVDEDLVVNIIANEKIKEKNEKFKNNMSMKLQKIHQEAEEEKQRVFKKYTTILKTIFIFVLLAIETLIFYITLTSFSCNFIVGMFVFAGLITTAILGIKDKYNFVNGYIIRISEIKASEAFKKVYIPKANIILDLEKEYFN